MRVAVVGHTYVVEANRGKFKHLVGRGHNVLLVSPREWLEADFGLRHFEPARELDAALFDCCRHGHVKRFAYPTFDALRVLRGWRADVLLAETEPGGVAALQSACFAACLGVPLVTFAWENLALHGRAKWAARPVYAGTRRLLAGSSGAATVARRAGYHGPVTVLPQVGVDPAPSLTRAAHGAKSPRTVLFIGRLDRKKGADLLLDALTTTADWRAVIVGDGQERASLAAQAARLGVADRVRFAGAVPHRDVPSFLADADAFVLPSRTVPGWAEQFGHVLAWAMAAGVPVVATRCGAIPEVVGDAGLLVNENDAPALAAALQRLTAPSPAADLSAKGRARAARWYTHAAVAARLEQALIMALERAHGDVVH
jgi:glycosyltransferase involved in cell wall biosynthesis